jgi:hypothetical protein
LLQGFVGSLEPWDFLSCVLSFPLWVNQGGNMSADQSGLIAQWNT